MGESRWALDTALDWIEDSIRWRGVVLHGRFIHWCQEWDGLPTDETCSEFAHCSCFDGAVFEAVRDTVRAWELRYSAAAERATTSKGPLAPRDNL